MTICDLKQKEVINIKDCKRLGFVGDAVSYTHLTLPTICSV